MKLKKHVVAFALALPFALLGASAQADGWFCSSRQGPLSNGYSMCAGSEAGTGVIVGDTTATLFQPDAFSDAPVTASRMSVSGGIFAGAASAGSSSSLGMLGGSATAESLNAVPPAVGEHATAASAKTDAAFFDSGTLIGAAGAPVGAPVSLRLTIDAAGAFAGGPINAAPSEATVRLSVFLNDRPILFGGHSSTGVVLTKVTPFVVLPIDLAGFHVGDKLAFGLRLEARAFATNEKMPDISYMSSQAKDVIARLYVDVPSANASFVSASGHLYLYGNNASPAPDSVPAPVTATAGDAQATVNFTAPASAGGSAITGYTVTSSPGGITATGTASPITVTTLTNDTAYTFTVTASNAAGMSVPSAPSNSVTPTAAPASAPAPTAIPLPVSGGGGSASIPVLLVLSAAYGWHRRSNKRRWNAATGALNAGPARRKHGKRAHHP